MKIINKDALAVCILVFGVMFIFPIIFSLPGLVHFKNAFKDFSITDIGLEKIRGEQYPEADTNIVIINTEGLKAKFYPGFIEILQENHPKVIGISFSKEQAETSANLIDSLSVINNNLVFSSGGNNLNSKILLPLGFDNSDVYQAVRRFVPSIERDGKVQNSLPLEIVKKYDKDIYNDFINQNLSEPLINYRGNYKQFYYLDAIDIFEYNIADDFLNGKIVICGNADVKDNFMNLEDLYFTPINESPVGRSFPDMYLTEIQANIISMMLGRNYIQEMPLLLQLLTAFLILYANLCFYLYILKKNKILYDLLSIVLFLVETFLILYLTIVMYQDYNFELGLTMTLFSITLGLLIFELYNESLKPLFINYFNIKEKKK